jgi:hypothetical protein
LIQQGAVDCDTAVAIKRKIGLINPLFVPSVDLGLLLSTSRELRRTVLTKKLYKKL